MFLAYMCEQLFGFIISTYLYGNFGLIWLFTAVFGDINSGNNETSQSNVLRVAAIFEFVIVNKIKIPDSIIHVEKVTLRSGRVTTIPKKLQWIRYHSGLLELVQVIR